MACLSEEQLVSYLAGSMSAADRSSTEEHLRECAACRERLEELRADDRLAGDLRRAFEDQTERIDDGVNGPAAGQDFGLGAGGSEGHPIADSIPGYEITREIHRGGQGVVYQAIQKATKRKVAIKVMREGPFAGKRDKARFEREVRILGQLRHPNIVTVHDSGTTAGCFFYTMDYVSGRPLDDYVALSKPSIDQTLRLFAKICEAVNAAHLQGVIHRDLKPGNIRIDVEGIPHVLDFGLAKVAAGQTTEDSRPVAMTVTGEFMGSLPWASPEQAEAVPGKIDLRTDVYSLGVILYQMLTGQFPYPVVGNVRDVMDNILKTEPARPSTIRRQINDEIETIVLKSLSKERERRYQTAGELGRDIERYLAGEPIEAKRDSGLYVLRKTLRRYKVPVGVAAGFVLVLAVSLAVSLSLWRHAATERDRAEEEHRAGVKLLAELRGERAARERAQLETLIPALKQLRAQGDRGARERAELEVMIRVARSLPGYCTSTEGVCWAVRLANALAERFAGKQVPPRCLLECADHLLIGGQPNKAVEMIRQAIADGGDDPIFHRTLGWALLHCGRKDQARAALRRVIGDADRWSAHPPSTASRYEWSAAYLLGLVTQHEYAAHHEASDAFACYPWFFIGQRMEMEGDPSAAIKAYRRCVELGRRPKAWYFHNWAAYRLRLLTLSFERWKLVYPGQSDVGVKVVLGDPSLQVEDQRQWTWYYPDVDVTAHVWFDEAGKVIARQWFGPKGSIGAAPAG